jgi:hypothetical protein
VVTEGIQQAIPGSKVAPEKVTMNASATASVSDDTVPKSDTP